MLGWGCKSCRIDPHLAKLVAVLCVARNRWRTRNQKGHCRAVVWWWWWGKKLPHIMRGKSSPTHHLLWDKSVPSTLTLSCAVGKLLHLRLLKVTISSWSLFCCQKSTETQKPHALRKVTPHLLYCLCFYKTFTVEFAQSKDFKMNFAISDHQLVWQASAMTHSPLREIADKPALSKWLTKQTST